MASPTKEREFPASISCMISQPMRDLIDREAKREGVAISDVMRELMALGVAAKFKKKKPKADAPT